MKKRNIVLMIVLSIVTVGIYDLYWYCSFQNQLKKETGMGFGGAAHFFISLITFGIYSLYWSYAVGPRLNKLGRPNNGVLYLVLTLIGLGIVANLLMQHEANQIK